MHFPNCFEYFVLTNSFWLQKIQSLLLYFKYSVLYVQLNSPKAIPNFKEPNLVGIIWVKIYENICCCWISCIFRIVLLILLRIIEFAGLTTRLKHLLKVVTYVIWHNKWARTLTWCKRWYFRLKWIYFACFPS